MGYRLAADRAHPGSLVLRPWWRVRYVVALSLAALAMGAPTSLARAPVAELALEQVIEPNEPHPTLRRPWLPESPVRRYALRLGYAGPGLFGAAWLGSLESDSRTEVDAARVTSRGLEITYRPRWGSGAPWSQRLGEGGPLAPPEVQRAVARMLRDPHGVGRVRWGSPEGWRAPALAWLVAWCAALAALRRARVSIEVTDGVLRVARGGRSDAWPLVDVTRAMIEVRERLPEWRTRPSAVLRNGTRVGLAPFALRYRESEAVVAWLRRALG